MTETSPIIDGTTTLEMQEGLDEPVTLLPSGDDADGIISDEVNQWRQRLIRLQRLARVLAPCMALLGMIAVLIWIQKLGGLSWEKGQAKLVFNWHPLFMIIAFNLMTAASLSFRYQGLRTTRTFLKLIHGMSWAVAALCMCFGLVAVFRSHNDGVSGYIANLYSLHSWIGILVFVVYLFQFFSGLVTFGIPSSYNLLFHVTQSVKAKLLQVHLYSGPMIYLAMMLTILLGIQEKEGFIGCAYKVEAVDSRPWKNFDHIPRECKISHLLGFLILFTGVCTSFALHSMDRGNYRSN